MKKNENDLFIKRNHFLNKINPVRCALLVVDMQNAFVGGNAPISVPKAEEIIFPLIKFIKTLRATGVKIVWIKSHHDLIKNTMYEELWPSHISEDRKGLISSEGPYFDIAKGLKPYIDNKDWVVEKEKYSIFYNTGLEEKLNKTSIDTLLFTGVATNVCVESSIREAYNYDLRSILVSDLTKTFSREMQINSMRVVDIAFGYVMSSVEINKIIKIKYE